MSFYRFPQIFLSFLLITGGIALYKINQKSEQTIQKLRSYKIQDEEYLVQSPYGFPLLSADSAHDSEYDPRLPILLQKLLPTSGDILHVGGMTGVHTVLIHKTRPTSRIIGTEGQPIYYGLLTKNIQLHGLEKKVHIYNLNPSNKSDALNVCREDDRTEDSIQKPKNCLTIKEAPIDSLGLLSISAVLIESHMEANKVIEGLQDTLKKSGYPPILIFPNVIFGKNPDGLWSQILKQGKYMIYKVEAQEKRQKLSLKQIDRTDIQIDEPCFIFITTELMPMTL